SSLCSGAARGEPRAVVDRSDDATCLLGLAGLKVEGVVLSSAGVKIVQLATDDPEAALAVSDRGVRPADFHRGGGAGASRDADHDPAAGGAGGGGRGRARPG